MYHYVYKLTCVVNDEFYFGCRSSKVTPEQDRSYMGSGTWARRKDVPYRKKEILAVFETRNDAANFELEMIRKHASKRKCMNIHAKSPEAIQRQKRKEKEKAMFDDIKKYNQWRMNKVYFCTNTKWISEAYPNQYRLDDQGVYIFIGNSR